MHTRMEKQKETCICSGVVYYTRAATHPIENDNSAPPVRKTTRIFAPDFAIPVTLESSLPGELTRVSTYLRANLQTI